MNDMKIPFDEWLREHYDFEGPTLVCKRCGLRDVWAVSIHAVNVHGEDVSNVAFSRKPDPRLCDWRGIRLPDHKDELAASDVPCSVHTEHRPEPLRIVVHHVQPLGMGGPNVPANKIAVCDTGHYSIHRLLGYLIDGKPLPSGHHEERRLAQAGYDAWVAAGKPGRPVYELW